jgi:beta-lactamase class A
MNRIRFVCAATALLVPAAAAARDGEIDALEARYGGRLGVYALDLGTGRQITHRADERFAMCSTFKLLAVGATLHRVVRGAEQLGRRVAYPASALLSYAPVTKTHVGAGGVGAMSVEALCTAAMEVSDNTAANLLVRDLGGPPAVTAFARSIGDRRTRLDRVEPDVNDAVPGDPRDTTTPRSIAADLRTLIFGPTLGAEAERLRTWMLACRTADARIPAGLPPGWRSGNKTGSGDHATAGDVAFVLPPAGAPKIVAAYTTASRADDDGQDATLAAVARIVVRRFTHGAA